MKAICQGGSTYDIFDDSLKVYEQLPAQPYIVRFSDKRGFYLEKYPNFEITESKIYGVHMAKVQKVINAFAKMNRNLGVILSGDKGIGKSLFAKAAGMEAITRGIPVIIVDTYYEGIASYINEIEQEVMVLFDEFDKTFGEVREKEGKSSPQAELLTLFDGLSVGKKLFVVTCNNLRSLNDYLVNRPGRFHYHFRFEYPSSEEVREYLEDKLAQEYYSEIENVVSFSNKVKINYDCLRAIAFELNNGEAFSEAIKDLNIVNIEREQYNIRLAYQNGLTAISRGNSIDMFDDSMVDVYMYDQNGENFVDISFMPTDAIYDATHNAYYVAPENIHFQYYEGKTAESAQKTKAESLLITRKHDRNIHYTV